MDFTNENQDSKLVYVDPKGRYKTYEKIVNGYPIRETVRTPIRRSLETIPSPDDMKKKKFERRKRNAHMAALMDCRKIDKFFGTGHQFVPVEKQKPIRKISFNMAKTWLNMGAEIVFDGEYKVYNSDLLIGSITEAIFDYLKSDIGIAVCGYRDGTKTVYKRP